MPRPPTPLAAAFLGLVGVLGWTPPEAVAQEAVQETVQGTAPEEFACPTSRMPLEGRASPRDSLTFRVDGHALKVCYGRPSARGRVMLGERIPFGKIWRTGANETTVLHTPIDLTVAGIAVPAGTYALYTVPGEAEWEIVVNRAYEQWGHERFYTPEIEAQEVGRGTVPVDPTAEHVETFTIRAEPRDDGGADLILEWEKTRIRVPLLPAAPGSGS